MVDVTSYRHAVRTRDMDITIAERTSNALCLFSFISSLLFQGLKEWRDQAVGMDGQTPVSNGCID